MYLYASWSAFRIATQIKRPSTELRADEMRTNHFLVAYWRSRYPHLNSKTGYIYYQTFDIKHPHQRYGKTNRGFFLNGRPAIRKNTKHAAAPRSVLSGCGYLLRNFHGKKFTRNFLAHASKTTISKIAKSRVILTSDRVFFARPG